MSSAKWRPLCLSLSVITRVTLHSDTHLIVHTNNVITLVASEPNSYGEWQPFNIWTRQVSNNRDNMADWETVSQSPCTTLMAGSLPAVSAVQGTLVGLYFHWSHDPIKNYNCQRIQCKYRYPPIYSQTSNIRHLSRQQTWSFRYSRSIACPRCCNYTFILDLTSGFNRLGKDNCKTRRETFMLWDLVCLILEVWQYIHTSQSHNHDISQYWQGPYPTSHGLSCRRQIQTA